MTVETATAVTAGTRVEWAPVPRVNLLPPEILQRRGFVKVQRRLGVGVLAVALMCGGGYWWAASGVTAAQEDLDQATAESVRLNGEKAKYDEVPRVVAQVRAAQAARQTAMANDILWYQVLNDLAMATPQTVWLSSATFTVGADSAGATTSADLLSPSAVGSVTLSGEVSGLPPLAGWIDSLDALTPFDGTAVTKAEAKAEAKADPAMRNQLTFSATSVLVPAALSHRYDVKPE